MRTALLILALVLVFCSLVWGRMDAGTGSTYANVPITSTASVAVKENAGESNASRNSKAAPIDFSTQVKPIFEKRCQPCHFPGGQMYKQMPFDRPETIKTLNTKLFTRIKDENERRVIHNFLAQ